MLLAGQVFSTFFLVKFGFDGKMVFWQMFLQKVLTDLEDISYLMGNVNKEFNMEFYLFIIIF